MFLGTPWTLSGVTTGEANDQLVASKEQLATLRKKLEEAQKLRDQAEKAKAEAEEAKAKAEREKDEAEQHCYDVGVDETDDALRAEIPVICHAYVLRPGKKPLIELGLMLLPS